MSTRHRRCSLVIPRVMRRHLPLLHALLTYRNCLVVMSPWRCNLSRFSFLPFYPLQFEDIVVGFFVSKTKRTVDITEKNSDWLTTLMPASGDSKSFKLVHTVEDGTDILISELHYQLHSRLYILAIEYDIAKWDSSWNIRGSRCSLQGLSSVISDCSRGG